MSNTERDRDLTPSLPPRHPAPEVAEHEVLLTFLDDPVALAFRDWWHTEGLELWKAKADHYIDSL